MLLLLILSSTLSPYLNAPLCDLREADQRRVSLPPISIRHEGGQRQRSDREDCVTAHGDSQPVGTRAAGGLGDKHNRKARGTTLRVMMITIASFAFGILVTFLDLVEEV